MVLRYRRQRAGIEFMDKGAKGWMINTAKRYWKRLPQWYDFDDILQEGQASYAETLWRYPTAKDRPHIMRLFQLVYTCKLIDLSNMARRQIDLPVGDDVLETLHNNLRVPDHGMFAAAMAMAPDEVRRVLKAIEAHPEKMNEPYAVIRKHDNEPLWFWGDDAKGEGYRYRETFNDCLCRMIGVDAGRFNLVELIRENLGFDREVLNA